MLGHVQKSSLLPASTNVAFPPTSAQGQKMSPLSPNTVGPSGAARGSPALPSPFFLPRIFRGHQGSQLQRQRLGGNKPCACSSLSPTMGTDPVQPPAALGSLHGQARPRQAGRTEPNAGFRAPSERPGVEASHAAASGERLLKG